MIGRLASPTGSLTINVISLPHAGRPGAVQRQSAAPNDDKRRSLPRRSSLKGRGRSSRAGGCVSGLPASCGHTRTRRPRVKAERPQAEPRTNGLEAGRRLATMSVPEGRGGVRVSVLLGAERGCVEWCRLQVPDQCRRAGRAARLPVIPSPRGRGHGAVRRAAGRGQSKTRPRRRGGGQTCFGLAPGRGTAPGHAAASTRVRRARISPSRRP